jgi:hypothetical protein
MEKSPKKEVADPNYQKILNFVKRLNPSIQAEADDVSMPQLDHIQSNAPKQPPST